MGQGIVSKQAFLPPSLNPPQSTVTHIQTKRYKHWIPVLELKEESSKVVLLYSHGNAEDLGGLEYALKELHRHLKINVVGYDYSGYGTSLDDNKQRIDNPQEYYCYDNVWAVYHHIKKNYKDPEIIVMGRSLGSGPATHLASRGLKRTPEVKGLVLQSPLLSAIRVVMKVPFTLPLDIFPNIDKIGKVEVPVYIIHGKLDQVVPVHHGMQLQELVKEKFKQEPFFIEGKGHNDIEFNDDYMTKMKKFISETCPSYKLEEM